MKKISNIAKRVAIASSVAAMSLLSLSANKANAAEFSWDFELTYGPNEHEAFGSFTFDDSIVTQSGGYALTSFSWKGEEKTVVVAWPAAVWCQEHVRKWLYKKLAVIVVS